ncbi:MAG: M48 family metalloprotease [Burkholderiaceae bacterium]
MAGLSLAVATAPLHAQSVSQAAPVRTDEHTPDSQTAPLPWRLKQIAQARTAATTEAPLPKPQTSLPTLGAPETQDLPPLEEKRIVREIRQELARAPEVLDDPELTFYLRKLAAKLTASMGVQAPYVEPFALRDPQLNAFALPGGLIGINSGLVTAASNENELAGVLAHEIGHVEQRHIARSLAAQKEGSLWSLAALGLAILAARSNSNSSSNAVQAAVMGGQGLGLAAVLAFSRDAEREADRVGLNLLQAAGYDVSGMVGVFQKLQAQGRLYESGGPVYQRTHPLTTERIADIQNRTRTVPAKPPVDSLDFRLAQARYMALSADTTEARNQVHARLTALLAESPAPKQGTVEVRSTFPRIGAYYGIALVEASRRDFAAARKSLAEAAKLAGGEDAHPSFLLASGRVAAGNNDIDGARKALTRMRASFGTGSAYADVVRDGSIDVLQNIGAHEEAIALLKDKNKISPESGTWRLLAKSYAARNDRMNQMRAQAESLALDGAWPAAVDAMKQARAAATGNFYAASEIDARLRELTVIAEEERKENIKRGIPEKS